MLIIDTFPTSSTFDDLPAFTLSSPPLFTAVLDAYGWPHVIADAELVARRLALNGDRAAGRMGLCIARRQ